MRGDVRGRLMSTMARRRLSAPITENRINQLWSSQDRPGDGTFENGVEMELSEWLV